MYLDEEGERERKGGREGRKEGSREAGGGREPHENEELYRKKQNRVPGGHANGPS